MNAELLKDLLDAITAALWQAEHAGSPSRIARWIKARQDVLALHNALLKSMDDLTPD